MKILIYFFIFLALALLMVKYSARVYQYILLKYIVWKGRRLLAEIKAKMVVSELCEEFNKAMEALDSIEQKNELFNFKDKE